MASSRQTPRGTGLRLLCLDGGGVRGLSSLLILKRLMETINQDNPPNPCDVFDMISGTSSGGLIALMLGRLRMSVDETIESYRMLAGRVFKNRSRLGWKGNLQGRFSAESLENAIKDILLKHGLDENTRLKDQELMSCKVFVTATSSSSLNPIALRSYTSPHQKEDIGVRIWEAARATSAASTFFDPIKINGRMYNDGGIGLNNPINLLWTEARSIWSDDRRRFSDNIKCIVSIGTGQDIISRAEVLGGVEKALVANSTDATSTAYEFAARHKDLHRSQRYFRFNAEVGLHNVGLNEADHLAQIASEVESYTLDGDGQFQRIYRI
ncbi:FabD/lysophospholipase-like protein [Stipitochalara longipes BDJ]|nr:FabD/lysophospholipase-like protein [Stipitochalara longipes BDJ]